MKRFFLSLVLPILSTGVHSAQQAETSPRNDAGNYRRTDSHFHLVDFLQNGEFLNTDHKFPGNEWGLRKSGRYATLPFGERGRRIEALLRGMELAKVDHIMVSGIPFVKKWSENERFIRPKYYLDSTSRMKRARDTDITVAAAILDYQQQYASDPAKLAELRKIHPFIAGFDGTDLGGVDLIVKRIKEFPGVWQGIGEVMSRHDDLTNLTTGERPRADHPALLRVGRFAGRHFLPISIHHNVAPISRNASEIRQPLYLDELVWLLRNCSWEEEEVTYKTIFIWCHAGISRRVHVDNLPFWIEEILTEFQDQLYIDLSWVVLEGYVYKELDRWAELIQEFSGRFMIGSDSVGTASTLGQELNRYQRLLARLSPEVRRKVAHENFASLMEDMRARRAQADLGEQGIVLDYAYEFPEYAYTERLPDVESFTRSRGTSRQQH